MNVLRSRGRGQLASCSLCVLQQLETRGDLRVARIELTCSGISIDGIRNLVVATFIQATKIKPNLRYVWIDADGSRIRVQSVTELIDLEIQNTDRAPERWVPAITVNCLLVCFICLVVFLARHVCPSEKIPTLRVRRICRPIMLSNHPMDWSDIKYAYRPRDSSLDTVSPDLDFGKRTHLDGRATQVAEVP